MGRLIDADAFIASLQEYIDKPMTAGLCATLIETFPTAYDLEKVVVEIKEAAFGVDVTYTDSEDVVESEEAIRIIRKGGINE